MPYFSSLANFIATVTSRFNKPRRSLSNEGILKQDIIDALTDSAKYADDTVQTLIATNGTFLNWNTQLVQTIYVDGVSGSDTRNGITNNSNATTGCVKTLARVAALQNGKATRLHIIVVGNLTHAADVVLDIPEIKLQVSTGVTLTVSKKSLGAYGEANYQIRFKSNHVHVYNQGTITIEAHAIYPTSPSEFTYYTSQGAFCLIKTDVNEYESPKYQIINVLGGTINVGNYCVFVTTGRGGGESNSLARFFTSVNTLVATFNLGTGATIHDLGGDRVSARQFHPSGPSDGGVGFAELVASPTTLQLFTKRGGDVRLTNALRRYHPTSSTDANVWEGEIVISTSNSDLYYKNSGTIRRVTTAAYS
jgi:hypothetical protein